MKRKLRNHVSYSIVVLTVLLLSADMAEAQVDYTIHANIIYHLTKYMEWPENKQDNFVIGVIGDTPLFEELQKATESRSVGKKKIIVKSMNAKSTEFGCEILFISDDESRYLKKIVEITRRTPTLLITEQDESALNGSCINFNVEDNHLILEINKKNIDAKNIKVASELLSLGKVIQ
jgi:hypothetical protein